MEITTIRIRGRKPTNAQMADLLIELKSALVKRGFSNYIEKRTGSAFDISDIRLSQKRIDKYGYNLSPYTGRRGRILSWKDWVEVNNSINKVLDRENVSANVRSLKGKFKIRKGRLSYGEEKWLREVGGENIGSMMNPIERVDAWQREGKRAKLKRLM